MPGQRRNAPISNAGQPARSSHGDCSRLDRLGGREGEASNVQARADEGGLANRRRELVRRAEPPWSPREGEPGSSSEALAGAASLASPIRKGSRWQLPHCFDEADNVPDLSVGHGTPP